MDFKTVLVPTDFSQYAQHAMRYAKAFAKRTKGRIHFVHVIDERFLEAEGVYVSTADAKAMADGVRRAARDRLEQAKRKAEGYGLEGEIHLKEGKPAQQIEAVAEEIRADLIIMATHGRSGLDRLILGSTCERLIRVAKVPVLAIKHPEHEFVEADNSIVIKKIMCPVDFSDFSRKAVPVAANLCRQTGATLLLAHIVDTWLDYPEFVPSVEINNSPHLRQAAEESLAKIKAEVAGVNVETLVGTGVPHAELARIIDQEGVDLAVITTHGRSGMSHLLLGSVTEKLIRTAGCPVLTIKPTTG